MALSAKRIARIPGQLKIKTGKLQIMGFAKQVMESPLFLLPDPLKQFRNYDSANGQAVPFQKKTHFLADILPASGPKKFDQNGRISENVWHKAFPPFLAQVPVIPSNFHRNGPFPPSP